MSIFNVRQWTETVKIKANGMFGADICLVNFSRQNLKIDNGGQKNIIRILYVLRRVYGGIVIFKVKNTELFCQVELSLSDYPLYGKQIAAS